MLKARVFLIERFFARRLVKIMGQIFFCRSAEKCNNSSKLLVWFFSVQQSARGKKIGGRKIFFLTVSSF
jgi:hypothetical protein